jgi:NTE family protein
MNEQQIIKPRIALALSGGGFRAALFHLGVIRRLAEDGWANVLDALSTVSGGSIVGAFAALNWPKALSEGGGPEAIDRYIISPFSRYITKIMLFLVSSCAFL